MLRRIRGLNKETSRYSQVQRSILFLGQLMCKNRFFFSNMIVFTQERHNFIFQWPCLCMLKEILTDFSMYPLSFVAKKGFFQKFQYSIEIEIFFGFSFWLIKFRWSVRKVVEFKVSLWRRCVFRTLRVKFLKFDFLSWERFDLLIFFDNVFHAEKKTLREGSILVLTVKGHERILALSILIGELKIRSVWLTLNRRKKNLHI